MAIVNANSPGRPKGRRYDNAEIARRHRERLKQKGISELRGLRPYQSELEVFDRLVDVLGYGSRNEMIICELLKLGKTHGLYPVREGV
ncbi:hypothetical protein ABKY47_002084 [Aeromonas hydrophila]